MPQSNQLIKLSDDTIMRMRKLYRFAKISEFHAFEAHTISLVPSDH